jgi:acyl-CoA synthetase (AMP-forming)/AMP-acid ligase II
MQGMMMNRPLRIAEIITFAEKIHPNEEIISRTLQGDIHETNYAEIASRSRRMSKALLNLGIKIGDRVATLAWNGFRHLELYFAISGIGAVCHTINPRLSSEQMEYVVNHADDKIIFLDLTFIPIVEAHLNKFPKTTKYVLMASKDHMPECKIPNVICYEDLVEKENDDFIWPEFDENTASGLCYTSGTTGNPKGVLYSHRSTVLHSLMSCIYNSGSFAPKKKILPIVPLFHANAWGLPYAAPISGTPMVFPGANLDGKSVYDLLNDYKVSSAWGVPTVWMGLLEEINKRGKKPDGLSEMLVGGSAAARSLIESFENMGVRVIHAWGMTETSPLGTSGRLVEPFTELPTEEQRHLQTSQGRKIFMVDLKIVDDDGKRLPEDGKSIGNLYIRGSTIARGYFNNEEASKAAIDDEGYFGTGDVASIDQQGFLRLTDRAKDLIKSGGEWISSIDLENRAMSHPDIENCAVIAIPHEKWDERPLLVVVPTEGKRPTKEDIVKHLEGHFAKWQMPDDVVYEDSLPLTATGKVSKLTLRRKYENHTLAS